MAKIYNNVIASIGNTPVIRLERSVPAIGHEFFAKVESFNPGGSVKDRIALSIIEDAEKSGKLKPGGTIVEATSGNTGVGLAMVAALRGYKCIFTMPEKISEEKRATLRAYGARVVVTPNGVAPEDPRSHYSVAKKFSDIIPGAYLTNQYHNPANWQAHYKTTGPELWEQMNGQIDCFVAGAGTGGTLSGVGKFLKEKNPNVKIVCADPIGSILHDLFYFKEVREHAKPYLVEGIGEDMLPDNVHFAVMDDFIRVSDRESFICTREVARTEGLLIGPSCGSALHAAIAYAKSGKLKSGARIVVMFPDSGRNYLTKAFNDNWLRENGLLPSLLAAHSVRDLLQAGTTSAKDFAITVDFIVKDAVRFAQKNGLTQLFVFDGERFAGVLDISLLLATLVSGRLRGDEGVLHLINSGALEVELEQKLDAIEPLLEKQGWVRVKGSRAVLTRADLAAFIAGFSQ